VSTELSAVPTIDPEIVARVILHGDLRQLSAAQKVSYYRAVCESVGLNPLTKPFDYLVLSGKEILYATRACTEQLRKIHDVSIAITSRELIGEVYVVTARATLPDGRTDESIGGKTLDGIKGQPRADAMMTAETKAKRRVTLSICGLGMLDETEVADITPARPAPPERQVIAAAVDPDPVDEAPAPDGSVRVMLIEDAPTSNPNVIRFTITLSNGEQVTTINNWLASLAHDALEKRTPVTITTRASRYGTDLVTITEYAPPAPTPAEPATQPSEPAPGHAGLPLTAKDIPF
jgi:hypothetical protein